MKSLSNRLLAVWPFIFFFILILAVFWGGVGQFWDWDFPLFKSHIDNFALQHLPSWETYQFGEPQAYMPALIWYLFVGLLGIIPLEPEHLLALIVAAILTVIYWFSYKILSGYLPRQRWATWVLALFVTLNPAIFYKLLAGHIPYLLGFAFFLALAYYISQRQQRGNYSALVVGFLWALSGVQVQFLIFSTILITTHWLINKEKFSWKQIFISMLIVVSTHSYWLVNFFNGATNLYSVSQGAEVATFDSLSSAPFFNVFTSTFTSATFIHRFFTMPHQFVSILLYLTTFVGLFFIRKFSREAKYWLVLWLTFAFIATGIFHSIEIPGLSIFYPLLREAGHAAPIVLFALGLLIASMSRDVPTKVFSCLAILAAFVTISSAVNIYLFLPKLDYEAARQKFVEFESLRLREGTANYRVIAYPFFHQNRFIDQPQNSRLGTPMSNSGWDSYLLSSGFEYLDNSQSFGGPQEKLLESYSLTVLDPYNVRYVFDFHDGIYQSDAKHFNNSNYTKQLEERNNDANFVRKLVAANPGRLRQVSSRIWEIIDYKPRVEVSKSELSILQSSATLYDVEVTTKELQVEALLRSRFHPGWQLKIVPLNSSEDLILAQEHVQTSDDTNKWLIKLDNITQLGSQYSTILESGHTKFRIVIEFVPEKSHRVFLGVSLATIIVIICYFILIRWRKQSQDVV